MTFDAFADFRMGGHVAIVTGGAQNIGEAIARIFAGAGASVVIADRNGDKAAETAATIAADTAPKVETNIATPPPAEPVATVAANTAPGPTLSPPVVSNDSSASTPAIKRLMAARNEGRQVASTSPPREVAPPATPRIAVIALGDSAIVGPAKQRIEERLIDAGFDVVDTGLIAGVEGRRDLPGVFAALRRDATVAIVINAEPVGSAPITFYGQVDTLYTANLTVRSYFIPEKRALGPGFRESVSFTAMGAATKAEEAIDPRLDRMLGELAQYRRRRG